MRGQNHIKYPFIVVCFMPLTISHTIKHQG